MKLFKLCAIVFGIVFVGGCVSNKCELGAASALIGTDTAVVGIAVDKNGYPKEIYSEVFLHPGQRVIYAGPDRFSIVYKNEKSPTGKVKYDSVDGVVVIDIPDDIFERKEFSEEFRKNKKLVFDYGISANGKELDPPLSIIPR